MQRFGSVAVFVSVAALAISLTSCLGSSTPNAGNGGVRTVSLSPSGNLSIDVGATQFFSASAQDATGHAIVGSSVQFVVTSPSGTITPPPLSITSGGAACAGTWDIAQAICTPGNPGIALVTAVANGVSSTQVTVYVHQHIDNLQVSQGESLPPTYDCFSQGSTWIYQGNAFSNGIDITNTVGPLVWSFTNQSVLTTNTNPAITPPLTSNQVQITAASPGITKLFAGVAGTTSNSIPITTCLVQYIRLQATGTTSSTVSVNNGTPVSLVATVVDTLGFTLTRPPLTWSTSEPEVASFSTPTSTTGTNSATVHNNLGGAAVTAACIPPTCNIGITPGFPVSSAMPAYVFASGGLVSSINQSPGYGAISIAATNSAGPATYTGWAATNGCGDSTNGCTSTMFSIVPNTSGTNPITTMVTLPRTPNSMMFNHQSRIYLGSDQGLMYVDAGGSGTTATVVSSASTPCNVALCGTVLEVSNDGKQVIVFDDSMVATPQVYVYNTSSGAAPVTDLVLPPNVVVSAAAFSPDLSKIFILTSTGTLYVYSTVNAFAPVSFGPAGTAVAFDADGSFAYVGGGTGSAGGTVSAFSTCALTDEPSVNLLGNGNSLSTNGTPPLQIFPSPVLQQEKGSDLITQNIYLLAPPNVQVVTAQYTQQPPPMTQPGLPLQYFCNAPILSGFTLGPTYSMQQGQFTPVYSRLVNNGTQIVVVARHIPAVLIFSVNNGTTTAIPLTDGGVDPLSASASSDGSQVYIAACDQYVPNTQPPVCASGSVHYVNTFTGNDLDVPYINNTTNNMCTGQGAGAPLCFPTMVALKPQ